MTVKSEYKRHGGPWDRGSADAYYGRAYQPHFYRGATYSSTRVDMRDMNHEEIDAYDQGYHEQVDSGDFKQWD